MSVTVVFVRDVDGVDVLLGDAMWPTVPQRGDILRLDKLTYLVVGADWHAESTSAGTCDGVAFLHYNRTPMIRVQLKDMPDE